MSPKTSGWTLGDFAIWLTVGAGIITLVWQFGDRYINPTNAAIRALEDRVLKLEVQQEFSHGDLTPFLKEQ